MRRAWLALADGTIFEGWALGHIGTCVGEVVFNTGMSGYQEILTDPSYSGQIVTMTYPLIGNYGINSEDVESNRPYVEGFVVKEASRITSNFRSEESLQHYLERYGIVGIQGIDTRELTRRLRDYGSQNGVISSEVSSPEGLVEKARAFPPMEGRDLASGVTCKEPYTWTQGDWSLEEGYGKGPRRTRYKVVVYDFGVKWNILRLLVDQGCEVKVVPATTPAEDVLAMNPDGVFLSNGPGDPAPLTYAIAEVKKLLGRVPMWGICLGHQIMGLAMGGTTYKLKFGHHGINHPVKDLATRKVEITSQNHGFVVDMDSLGDEVEVTHINCNDQTVEGIRHKSIPAFSVQYHPEASPGPHDSRYLFTRFAQLMDQFRER